MLNVWLDDMREPNEPDWVHLTKVCDVQELLIKGEIDNLSLDYNLECQPLCKKCSQHEVSLDETCMCKCHKDPGNGYALIIWMIDNKLWPKTKPIVHSGSYIAKDMRQLIDGNFPRSM